MKDKHRSSVSEDEIIKYVNIERTILVFSPLTSTLQAALGLCLHLTAVTLTIEVTKGCDLLQKNKNKKNTGMALKTNTVDNKNLLVDFPDLLTQNL